jgi:copper homeostasis protein
MESGDETDRTSALEVIVCTVEDAVEAARGGADRLEIVRELEYGGFTPPLELVREIRRAVDLPLRIMLREEPGYGLTEVIAAEKLCCLASAFDEMAVDGVVLGFLRGGSIDVEMTRKVLACAPRLKATFHHAFEDAADKLAAIEELKTIQQIDRILAHGGDGHWAEKAARLEQYARAAGPEIDILAGGGVDADVIDLLMERTSIREFHTGGAARKDGAVRAELVAKLVQVFREPARK